MDIFGHILSGLSRAARDHLPAISMAMVATCLAVFGNDINGAIRKRIRNCNFFVRALIFVMVCAFGYGLFTVVLASILTGLLAEFGNILLAPAVVAVFVLVGILAERKKQI